MFSNQSECHSFILRVNRDHDADRFIVRVVDDVDGNGFVGVDALLSQKIAFQLCVVIRFESRGANAGKEIANCGQIVAG